jgi:hypothetical protein
MTVFLCDSCSRQFPGGSEGSTFLVRPNGRTDHFCSNACLRAFTNGLPRTNVRRLVAIAFVAGAIMETVLQRLFTL